MINKHIYSINPAPRSFPPSRLSLTSKLAGIRLGVGCQLSIIFLLFASTAFGQSQVLTLNDFLNNVKEKNISYIVEKYNVDIAKANAEAAKVFPDPNLSLGGSDNEERKLKMGYTLDAGLDYTFELGNKRKARINVARSEAEVTGALLEDYFRNLRADATLSYFSVLKYKQLYALQLATHDNMNRLAHADSIRFKLGSIMEVDAKQSALEADIMWNEVLQSEADFNNSLTQLSLIQGDLQSAKPDSIAGNLAFMKRKFDLLSLITEAQNNRADLQAALKSKELSQHNLQLAKANRAIDLGFNVGVSRNAEVRNEIAPAPAFTGVAAGISIPLKFSNTNKGEIKAAQFALRQSEASYEATELQIQAEVTQAFQTYATACKQVEQFNTGLLTSAKMILDKKRYSYERGETGLLEVINAQHTYNSVQQTYYETLYNCAEALVELERASGIWDID